MRPSSLNRAVLLLLAVVACSLRPAAAGPAESSVSIEVSRANGVRFSGYRLPVKGEGMGVVTPAREIATAAHVVWGATVITVTDAKGAKLAARVQRFDRDVDVALLRVEQPLGDLPGFARGPQRSASACWRSRCGDRMAPQALRAAPSAQRAGPVTV